MNRTIEQWSGCQPEAMATEQSDVARTFAFADAKADILELHRENERLRSGYYMNEENADYAVDTAMKGTR